MRHSSVSITGDLIVAAKRDSENTILGNYR